MFIYPILVYVSVLAELSAVAPINWPIKYIFVDVDNTNTDDI